MNRLNWCGVVLAAVAVLGLSGCPVPLPPLGYERQSRTNLPDQVPDFIVTGKTTRQEVLLSLGVPDSYSPDGRWFAYRTSKHAGGVLFVVPYGGALEVSGTDEQLLIVRFDSSAIVIDATLEKRTCPHLGHGTSPCLEFPDPASSGALVEPETTSPIAVYERAWWALGADCFSTSRPHKVRIILTTHGMLAVADDGSNGAAPTRYWIPYRQVARAEIMRTGTFSQECGLFDLKDGRRYSVVIMNGWRFDTAATDDLVGRVNRALAAQQAEVVGEVATTHFRRTTSAFVTLPPYESLLAPPVAPRSEKTTVRIEAVQDARSGLTGSLIGARSALGISLGTMTMSPFPDEAVYELLRAELGRLGHRSVREDADFVIDPQLTQFEVRTPSTLLYWDINGVIALELGVTRRDGTRNQLRYDSTCTERTYLNPNAALVKEVLQACLANLGAKVREDPALERMLARQ
jgi:hypothetical protein